MGREQENDALCSRLLDAFVKAAFWLFSVYFLSMLIL
jgi:hypothetical protein